MPQYKKVFDAGLYSSGGGFTRVGVPTLRSVGASGKQVAKSLRFRAANSAYLNRTFGAPTTNTRFTYSGWIKRGALSANAVFFSIGQSTGIANFIQCYLDTSNQIHVYGVTSSSAVMDVYTTVGFRDPSAWYHVVVAIDTTDGTGSNRVKIYVNGVLQTITVTTTIGLNAVIPGNVSGYIGGIGAVVYNASYTNYLDGYLADVNFIDGSALTPSSFGEYNSDNIWVPKAYSGSYSGTNSFYLDFSDVALTSGSNAGYGKDTSGNGNYWNTSGLSATAGTTYDSMYDSPTDYDNSIYGAGNYAVLNPLNTHSSSTLSNGNLQQTCAGGPSRSNATINVPSSGKWYCEFINSSSANANIGIGFGVSANSVALNGDSAATNSYHFYASTLGYVVNNGSHVGLSSWTNSANQTFQVAVDVDNGKVWLGQNNVWWNSTGGSTGDPSTGANPTFTINSAGFKIFTYIDSVSSVNWIANFGQRAFSGTVPTNFKALNTKNITRPTDANMWFYGDTPDLVWIKNRSATSNHSLTDTVRGVGLGLTTSTTPTAENGDQDIAEMNKFGMTVIGASSRTTASANNFVYWAWKAGGAATTNTSGSITSQVSANVAAGFSVVTYTGTGTAGATVGHGLGVIPSMIIGKNRGSVVDWFVGHTSIAWTNVLRLNTTDASAANSVVWNNTAPDSSKFTLGNGTGLNESGKNIVAYCFAPVAGYSAFGSYTGNALDDGPFVYLGFRPRFLMIKQSTASGTNWLMIDTSRSTYNVAAVALGANSSLDEASFTTTAWLDVLSNGFKIKSGSAVGGYTNVNISGNTYIYAAFAENPFKISRAR